MFFSFPAVNVTKTELTTETLSVFITTSAPDFTPTGITTGMRQTDTFIHIHPDQGSPGST